MLYNGQFLLLVAMLIGTEYVQVSAIFTNINIEDGFMEDGMGRLLVGDLDDRLIAALKRRATRNGRSAESEHHVILETSLSAEIETFAEMSARFRAETRSASAQSDAILREARWRVPGEDS